MPRTPRLVEWSVTLYRLLLAAYPPEFRNEYEEAMAQLFRDTALDSYQEDGFPGLSAVWLRTLTDFLISVIRERGNKSVNASSESVLLHEFLRQWRQFGSAALSVTDFSTWYGLHLLRLCFRRPTRAWATLTAIIFGIWFASCFDSFNWMRGQATRVDLRGGLVQIEHCYDLGEPISYEQDLRNLRAWWEKNPGLAERLGGPGWPWEISFFSNIPGGSVLRVIQWRTTAPDRHGSIQREPVLIQPFKSWRLRLPFGILPALLLIWTIRVYLRRSTYSVAVVQST